MSNRRPPLSLVLSAFVFTTLYLIFSITAQAQTVHGTHIKPGVPIRGIDVKLGKNPGGQARLSSGKAAGVLVRKTDDYGNFDFGVLPAGEYVMVLRFPAPGSGGKGAINPPGSNIKVARLTLIGAVGGELAKDWNFETNKASDVPATERLQNVIQSGRLDTRTDTAQGNRNGPVSALNANTKAGDASGIVFQADGKRVVKGNVFDAMD